MKFIITSLTDCTVCVAWMVAKPFATFRSKIDTKAANLSAMQHTVLSYRTWHCSNHLCWQLILVRKCSYIYHMLNHMCRMLIDMYRMRYKFHISYYIDTEKYHESVTVY